MNYTKGEWKYQQNDYDFDFKIYTDEVVIGTAHCILGEVIANANLIAAAPNLYEVLKQIKADYEDFAKTGDGDLFDERLGANIMDAEQALTKAEGGK